MATDHDRPNYVPEIKRALTDVRRVCDALGLTSHGGKTVRRQSAGLIILCPVHQERTPSCSVQLRDGALLWKCHACGASGDVLSLIGAVRGLSLTGSSFREVLIEAARMGGLWQIVDALEGHGPKPEPRPEPKREHVQEEPVRDYPDVTEVQQFWSTCVGVASDHADANVQAVSTMLSARKIDPMKIEAHDLARVLPSTGALPRWCMTRFGDWREAGYLLVIPMYAPDGAIRSVRGWHVHREGAAAFDGPKRIPPFGHRASGMMMCDEFALALLRGTRPESEIALVCIEEGEPDFLTRATVTNHPSVAVMGLVSGSWSSEWAGKMPLGCKVAVRTHHDQAGDRYALEIIESLDRRCFTYRGNDDKDQESARV